MTDLFSQARWIWTADDGCSRFAVRRFRAHILLGKSETLTVRVSADSRYVLYVDGVPQGRGPLRSDVRHYSYETYDVTLDAGEHILAAVVLAYSGSSAPVAEMHDRGAFVLEARRKDGSVALSTTPGTWRVQTDHAYKPILEQNVGHNYMAIGASEHVRGSEIPEGWLDADFDDSSWEVPVVVNDAYLFERPSDMADPGGRWRLEERSIPHLKYESHTFLEDKLFPLTVPANSVHELIVDAGAYAIGYPNLEVEGGVGSTVEITYAEALSKDGKKHVRDDRNGTDVTGFSDIYEPSGSLDSYEPLHWRAFRFIKLTIRTAENPVTIDSFFYFMTGYPWKPSSKFSVENAPAELASIMDVDFRTLERCTAETFMDCPYYEQLQYVGDTRLQALLSYITTGDTRLGERAVRLFYLSRTPEGLTQSRYPNRIEQIIPPFSLIWILMVEDLWRFSPDAHQTVADSLLGCRGVLEWFGRQLTPDGVLGGQIPHWNFVDWSKEWLATGGVPPVVAAGLPCATLNLQYLAALRAYVRLRLALGDTRESEFWEAEADMLADSIFQTFWDPERNLFREGPDESWGYSQHAQAWAILTDLVPDASVTQMVDALHNDQTLVKTTFYHTFYVIEALAKVGRLEKLWDHWLSPWRDALKLNLTTWPEKPEPSRSDCHAWSAWPTYAFLKHVLGVRPGRAAFAKVTIAPQHVDGWDVVSGRVPTPAGLLKVKVDWSEGASPKIETEITKK